LEGRACNFSLVDFSKGVKLFVWENLLLCEVPKGNSHFKVAMWAGDPAYQPAVASAAGKAEDLSKLTGGGSAAMGRSDHRGK
jgi:hypothetical protein